MRDACGDAIGLCMLPEILSAETEINLSSSRKTIYTGDVVNLGIEEVLLPGGRHMALEVVRHPGGAAVVAIDDAERVCLLRQYRHASGGWLWELPAGKIDSCEGPEETALRELQEEAGLRADDWHKLGVTITTPGFCDERIHLFLARELTSVPSDHHAHEIIEIHWVPFNQALAWIQSGELCDAKTLIGLFLADRFLRETKQ
jgi:8-oxo-dGTP pyrophosphatase MutT (NUDIX family)